MSPRDPRLDQAEKRLRIIGYVAAFFILGTVLCFILGALKIAVQTLLILGLILLVIALALMVVYYRVKSRNSDNPN